MLYKIITCRCNELILEEKETENIVSTKRNFSCNCNRLHEVLVLTCKDHPFVCDIININKKCFCYECEGCEVCAICVEKRYNLNYLCTKFCLLLLPDYIKKEAVTIKYFLDEKMTADPFFILKTKLLL